MLTGFPEHKVKSPRKNDHTAIFCSSGMGHLYWRRWGSFSLYGPDLRASARAILPYRCASRQLDHLPYLYGHCVSRRGDSVVSNFLFRPMDLQHVSSDSVHMSHSSSRSRSNIPTTLAIIGQIIVSTLPIQPWATRHRHKEYLWSLEMIGRLTGLLMAMMAYSPSSQNKTVTHIWSEQARTRCTAGGVSLQTTIVFQRL